MLAVHSVRAMVFAALLVLAGTSCRQEMTLPIPGHLSGSVTLLGTVPSNVTGMSVTLYSSLAALDSRTADYQTTLTATSGLPRSFDFSFENVAPGEYYVLACFNFGCGESRDGNGNLRKVSVFSNVVTEIGFSL